MEDKTEKTNSPLQGPSPLYRIKVDVRSQQPPPLTSHVLLTSLCSGRSEAGLEYFSHQMSAVLTSAVCLTSEFALVMQMGVL